MCLLPWLWHIMAIRTGKNHVAHIHFSVTSPHHHQREALGVKKENQAGHAILNMVDRHHLTTQRSLLVRQHAQKLRVQQSSRSLYLRVEANGERFSVLSIVGPRNLHQAQVIHEGGSQPTSAACLQRSNQREEPSRISNHCIPLSHQLLRTKKTQLLRTYFIVDQCWSCVKMIFWICTLKVHFSELATGRAIGTWLVDQFTCPVAMDGSSGFCRFLSRCQTSSTSQQWDATNAKQKHWSWYDLKGHT